MGIKFEYEDVRTSFGVSAVCSYAYYMFKSLSTSRSFNAAICMAGVKTLRLGCAGGAFAVVTYSMTTGIENFRQKNDKLDIIVGAAAGGAAVKARYGIKSASCAAIGIATVLMQANNGGLSQLSSCTLRDLWVKERQKKKNADEEAKQKLAVN